MRRITRLCALAGRFAISLVRSNIELARIIARPSRGEAMVLEIELHLEDSRLITLYAAMVTLTPGTLALALREDMGTLFVHVVTRREIDEVRDDLLRLQQRIGEALA